LTGELSEVLKRRKVNIYYVQKTKWKGEKAKSIGGGYTIIYSRRTHEERLWSNFRREYENKGSRHRKKK